jgi:hypothetical protein
MVTVIWSGNRGKMFLLSRDIGLVHITARGKLDPREL